MNTITTYKISDHPDQAAVLDKHRDINVDHSWWHECVLDEWKDKLESMGFDSPEISYSGFWSQGDGACFTCDRVPGPETDPEVMVAWTNLVGAAALFGVELEEDDPSNLAYGKVEHNGSYYHENSVSVRWDVDRAYWWGTDYLPDEFNPYLNALEKAITEYFEDRLSERVRDLCREIYRDLEKEYDYLTSDEVVRETLEANDYDLDETGEIV